MPTEFPIATSQKNFVARRLDGFTAADPSYGAQVERYVRIPNSPVVISPFRSVDLLEGKFRDRFGDATSDLVTEVCFGVGHAINGVRKTQDSGLVGNRVVDEGKFQGSLVAQWEDGQLKEIRESRDKDGKELYSADEIDGINEIFNYWLRNRDELVQEGRSRLGRMTDSFSSAVTSAGRKYVGLPLSLGLMGLGQRIENRYAKSGDEELGVDGENPTTGGKTPDLLKVAKLLKTTPLLLQMQGELQTGLKEEQISGDGSALATEDKTLIAEQVGEYYGLPKERNPFVGTDGTLLDGLDSSAAGHGIAEGLRYALGYGSYALFLENPHIVDLVHRLGPIDSIGLSALSVLGAAYGRYRSDRHSLIEQGTNSYVPTTLAYKLLEADNTTGDASVSKDNAKLAAIAGGVMSLGPGTYFAPTSLALLAGSAFAASPVQTLAAFNGSVALGDMPAYVASNEIVKRIESAKLGEKVVFDAAA